MNMHSDSLSRVAGGWGSGYKEETTVPWWVRNLTGFIKGLMLRSSLSI